LDAVVRDIVVTQDLEGSTIVLHDIDESHHVALTINTEVS